MAGARVRTLRVVDDRPTLAGAIRNRRLQEDLTQADVGRLLSVRQQTVGAWERGERPQPRFFEPLARFLDLDSAKDVKRLADTTTEEVAGREAPGEQRGQSSGSTDEHVNSTRLDRLVDAFSERVRKGPLSDAEASLFRTMADLAGRDE